MFFDRHRMTLLPREIRNLLNILVIRLFRNIHQKIKRSDIAYMYVEHPIILPFVLNIRRHIGINIHLVKPSEDFSKYRKVIVPNGLWPSIKRATENIPASKKVFCEVGFYPQNRNLYFDSNGVHGHSSIRNCDLSSLPANCAEKLNSFREAYVKQNHVRVKWDSVPLTEKTTNIATGKYGHNFIFVPLQLERDTAFELCPFRDNQQIIEYVESTLPNERIIFKVHPLDKNRNYQVSRNNLLLPSSNKDLKQLICQSMAVVGSNSFVILEALMFRKKSATYGIGFTTNHNVTLECHENLEKLSNIGNWQPDWQRVDAFLSLLLSKQISIDFHKSAAETDKLVRVLREHAIILTKSL